MLTSCLQDVATASRKAQVFDICELVSNVHVIESQIFGLN
jgi:hypothetical protein